MVCGFESRRGSEGADDAPRSLDEPCRPPHSHKIKQKQTHEEKQKQMTDTTSTTEDLELFDNAKQEFPSKYDLRDRLVAIWVTGKKGERPGQKGESYPWVETVTLVMDDPNGTQDWDGMVKNEDGDLVETLVPSVVAEGPTRLNNFQWSAGGPVSRLEPRIMLKDKKTDAPIYRPLIGRINERKSTQKGRNNPWGIATCTEDEMKYISENFADKLRAITIEVKGLREGTGSDEKAFD